MKLKYNNNGIEVRRGDPITVFDDVAVVSGIITPTDFHPQGWVTVSFPGADRPRNYHPHVIGATFHIEEHDAQHQEHQAVSA